ncbi:MAG: serine/threonine-protein kinase, partial [Nitrospirota bacterium]
MIGRYEIRRMLGEGTMGIVYHGWDSRLERNVAIKVLSPQSEMDSTHAEQIAQFLREAKITSALKHPHIVEVYDIGDDPVTGMSYLVMEFVKGVSLQRILKERHLTTGEILTLICQVADGLDYAAEFSIVHRDIKPANILVDPVSLLPKLLDFGIAKKDNTDATHVGAICGTPHYMSPEQCRGDALDARSDLFSLGSVLYEMLTDRKAFPGETLASVMTGILDPDLPIPPSELRQELSGAVDRAVMKALAKNPADRF